MQHCKRQSVPIIWDQSTYAEKGVGEMWEAQARFGYCSGIAMALHLPDGRHFFLGVDRDKPVPPDRAKLTRMVADLQLFAVHAQDAALRILTPSSGVTRRAVVDAPGAGNAALDDGRQDGLGGRRMSRESASERPRCTSTTRCTSSDCVNKHQAVLKALRLGLIR